MTEKDLIAKPGICPICGASIDNYNNIEFDSDSVVFDWECKCGAHGSEAYHLEFCGHYGVNFKRTLISPFIFSPIPPNSPS